MAEGDKKNPKQTHLGGIAIHKDLEALGDWLFFPYGNFTRLAPKSDAKAETSCLHCSDSAHPLGFVLAFHSMYSWILTT